MHNRAYFEIGITHPRKICHQLIKKFNVRVSGCPSYGAEVKIHTSHTTVKGCNQREFHTATVYTRLSHSVDGKTLTVFTANVLLQTNSGLVYIYETSAGRAKDASWVRQMPKIVPPRLIELV